MKRATDWNNHTLGEGDRQRHVAETITDPIQMAAQKDTGFIGIALHGNGDDHGALGAADAQCHAAGAWVAAHFDGSVHAVKGSVRSRDGFRFRLMPHALYPHCRFCLRKWRELKLSRVAVNHTAQCSWRPVVPHMFCKSAQQHKER